MAKAEKKQVSLEAGLWNACNKLRGSVTATDYVNVVLGLLFLRFAYDKFNAQREKLLADEEFDEISAKQNVELYDKYTEKIIKPPFCKLMDSQISVLEKGRETFTKLSTEEQVDVLLQIVALVKTGRAGGCNLKPIGGVEKSGVLTLSSTLSNWKKKYSSAAIIDVSPAGLFEKRTTNLLDLI